MPLNRKLEPDGFIGVVGLAQGFSVLVDYSRVMIEQKLSCGFHG